MLDILHDLNIHHGQPVIAQTRVPVNIVLGSLAGGMSYEDLSQEYGVTTPQIRACLSYAADLIASETVISLPSA